MKLDKQLNLVIPCDTDMGRIYVYAQPVAREVFERYALVMSKAFSQIYTAGGGIFSGAAVAKSVLSEAVAERDRSLLAVAAANGEPNLDQYRNGNGPLSRDLKEGLFNELWRLCNVVAPVDGQWQTMPLDDAIRDDLLDEKDISEVENIVVFFTVLWHMHRKADRVEILTSALRTWDAHLESSTLTAFRSGLQTSTQAANTGAKAAPSSIPS